jgi:hypothetical protein
MTDPFETLIHQLGISLNVPLHVDRHHSCTLQIHQKLHVQLQVDAAQEKLWIASFLCELLPGKFRENVLSEALKANSLPDPRTGIFGFLSMTNRLTLHQVYRFPSLDGEKLAMYVAGFIDYAELWREAVERGQASPAPIHGSASTNPFGFKR